LERRQLGTSDLYVSKMGLGCMSLGTNQAHAESIIKAALEAGINYFDTADLYDFGMNEEIVGKSLQPVRDEVVIATKVGNRWNEQKDGWRWDPSKAYIKEAVKDSLRRLRVDYIDLYQLHGGTINDPIDETIEAFEELKEEGLIRYYGISSIRPNVIQTYAEQSNIVSNMMQYSLLDRRPEEWFPLLQEKNISVICRGPLAKGLLTTEGWSKASEKVRQEGYLDYSPEECQELITQLEEKFIDSRTLNEVALQFCLRHEAVAAVIPGASSVEQLKENIRAAESSALSDEEYEILSEITKEQKYMAHRP
jgi:aryl-alcohol dehydrogenase-like predicted oxidoreductase